MGRPPIFRLVVAVFGALTATGTDVGAQALPEPFLRSTVLVTHDIAANQVSFGSGFLVFRPVSGDQGQVFLVTNKHVLPPEGAAQSIEIRVMVGAEEESSPRLVEVEVVGKNGKYLPNVRVHPKGFDVAVVNVTDTMVEQDIDAVWIPLEAFSTPERLKNENITVGDEIFLLGYPDAIFDQRNASPILRRGVIATVPREGYAFNDDLRARFGLPDRIDGFLIDADVFPGSSGSVVVLKQQLATINSQWEIVVGRAKRCPYVLGIVSGSIPVNDTALGTNERIGLGVVYSANVIRDVIELSAAAPGRLVQLPRSLDERLRIARASCP